MIIPLTPSPGYCPAAPLDSLPEPIRGAVLQAAMAKDVPVSIAVTDAIAAAAAVVHCGYDCIAPDGEHLPTTINTCAVAPSADGKGRSLRFFFRRFLEAQKAKHSSLAVDPKGEAGGPCRIKVPVVEAMINRISYARLMQEIDGYGMNLTIQREEGASFLKTDLFKCDTDALTQLWSGDPPLDHFVMGKEIVAAEARVSLGFRIQPDLMYEYLRGRGRNAVKLGFWPRSVAALYDPNMFPGSRSPLPFDPRAANGKAFHARLDELADEINSRRFDGCRQRIGVALDENATGFMLELGYHMKKWRTTFYREIQEAAGRGWENTLRLATVFHIFCNGSGLVTSDMVRRAWDVVAWSLHQHYLIFVAGPAASKLQNGAGLGIPVQQRIAKIPKPAKLQRPLEDALFVLTCLDRLRVNRANPQTSDLLNLSGLSERRFKAAVNWLKLERIISTTSDESATVVRIR